MRSGRKTTKSKETEQEIQVAEPEDIIGSEEDDGSGDWILTYADMVTLLLCFFVLLFAMSSVKEETFEQLVKSLTRAIGKQNVPEAGTREGLMMQNLPAEKEIDAVDELGGLVQKEIQEIETKVREFIMFNNLQGQVKVEKEELGILITLSDLVLFPTGKAKMTSVGLEIMEKLYEIIKQFPQYYIRIKGHTDNVPISTAKFESNWELSANRACEVVRFLIERGINPKMLSAEGYAKYHPVATNDNPEGRAKNRRVEIKIERRVKSPDAPKNYQPGTQNTQDSTKK